MFSKIGHPYSVHLHIVVHAVSVPICLGRGFPDYETV
jgi:hypothetical protein